MAGNPAAQGFLYHPPRGVSRRNHPNLFLLGFTPKFSFFGNPSFLSIKMSVCKGGHGLVWCWLWRTKRVFYARGRAFLGLARFRLQKTLVFLWFWPPGARLVRVLEGSGAFSAQGVAENAQRRPWRRAPRTAPGLGLCKLMFRLALCRHHQF